MSLLSNPRGQITGERSAPIHPLQQIRVFGELSFSHKITPLHNSSSQTPYSDVTVNGRIDHGIGRIMFCERRTSVQLEICGGKWWPRSGT